MTEKQYKLERWSSESLYYSFPTGSVHQGVGYVIEKVEKDLNQLADENVQLKRKKERYKILAESRGERLDNYICTLNKFIKEHLEDESCNEAAKRVLREVSGTFVKEYDVSAENRKLRQENEELKQELEELKEIGDYQADRIKELQEFEDKVFDSLNDKIKKGEKAIEWGESSGADVGAMGFHIESLKQLKKELKE